MESSIICVMEWRRAVASGAVLLARCVQLCARMFFIRWTLLRVAGPRSLIHDLLQILALLSGFLRCNLIECAIQMQIEVNQL